MNGYKEAMDVLRKLVSCSDMLWEIAKISPSSVVKAAKNLGIIQTESEEEKLRKMVMSCTDKITAIKGYRFATGVGLKEAKEAVESIKPNWN